MSEIYLISQVLYIYLFLILVNFIEPLNFHIYSKLSLKNFMFLYNLWNFTSREKVILTSWNGKGFQILTETNIFEECYADYYTNPLQYIIKYIFIIDSFLILLFDYIYIIENKIKNQRVFLIFSIFN